MCPGANSELWLLPHCAGACKIIFPDKHDKCSNESINNQWKGCHNTKSVTVKNLKVFKSEFGKELLCL